MSLKLHYRLMKVSFSTWLKYSFMFVRAGHFSTKVKHVLNPQKGVSGTHSFKLMHTYIAHMVNSSRRVPSAYSCIGAIAAIGTGPPQNGGLQISYIWFNFVHFGKHLNICFHNFTFH